MEREDPVEIWVKDGRLGIQRAASSLMGSTQYVQVGQNCRDSQGSENQPDQEVYSEVWQ